MKKFLLNAAAIVLAMMSCQESILLESETLEIDTFQKESGIDSQRLVLSSPYEVQQMIDLIEMGISPSTRAGSNSFESLMEANKREVLSTLTEEQLEAIAADEEDLEFCPADSVIADMQFAQLLNAEREIQVGQTVYKYYSNGVAYTDQSHASELKDIASAVAAIEVTEDNAGSVINITPNICFSPANYGHEDFEDTGSRDPDPIGSGGGGGGTSTTPNETEEKDLTGYTSENSIILSNGVTIPSSDIRDAYYKSETDNDQDGNWFHRTWTGFFGRNIVAIKHFSETRKLTLNFYDQNYIVYANIGTKLKMQKKRFGIWWNIKSQNMVLGWDAVSVRYKMASPVPSQDFTMPGMTNPTVTTYRPFPFSNENIILFKIPFVNYDFTSKDLNKAFKSAAQSAFKGASEWARNQGLSSDKIGLFSLNDIYAYVIHGPQSTGGVNKRSLESKFHAKWLSGECEFHFSIGSSVSLKKINLSFDDGVELFSGRVFGAIKYNGKWLGAKILLYPQE